MTFMAEQRDCLLIAPCGWGKTLAFFLPMVLWPHRIIAIISPLIALMNDQMQVVYDCSLLASSLNATVLIAGIIATSLTFVFIYWLLLFHCIEADQGEHTTRRSHQRQF